MSVKPVKILIAIGVAVIHVDLIGSLQRWSRTIDHATLQSSSSDSIFVALPTPKGTRMDDVPMPIVRLSSVSLALPTLIDVVFEDPDADTIPGIIAATSAPQPLRSAVVEHSAYALRAGLTPGESVTIVLSVEVLADGSVGQVSVQSSSGNPSVDLEAIALARAVRWVPGTLHRHAISMRVQYSVTLSVPA